MRISRSKALAIIWLGIAGNGMAVVLGLLTPFDDPSRDVVDNALVLLGAMGLLNAWLVGRAALLSESAGVRVALGLFALLSAMALSLTDFGSSRSMGWAIKVAGVAVLGLVITDLVRRS